MTQAEWHFPENKPYTRKTLGEMCCAVHHDPEEQDLYIVQKCHPREGLDALYSKETGILQLQCTTCNELVMEIKVAQ